MVNSLPGHCGAAEVHFPESLHILRELNVGFQPLHNFIDSPVIYWETKTQM